MLTFLARERLTPVFPACVCWEQLVVGGGGEIKCDDFSALIATLIISKPVKQKCGWTI